MMKNIRAGMAVALVCLMLFQSSAFGEEAPSYKIPCDTPLHHAMDFIIGDWRALDFETREFEGLQYWIAKEVPMYDRKRHRYQDD